jgi:hypothetical protein
MKQLGRVLWPALGGAALMAVLSSVPARPVDAQHIAPVTVTNVPLPTTVTNTPAVTISGTPAVSVANGVATPLFVKNVDDPARQPFARDCAVEGFDSLGRGTCSFEAVPSGKRWVIETMSGQLSLDAGVKPIHIDLQLCSAGYATDNYFPAVFQGTSAFFFGDNFTVNQPVRLYSDNVLGCHGSTFVNLLVSNATPDGSAFFILSGHLVDVP